MNTIYTTQYCGWCKRAKVALDQRGIEYREVDVTEDRELQKEMTRRTGRQSVPQIFLDDEHIGGYDDLIRYFSTEKAAVNS
jgi:GrxC family glutaredoxin